MINGGKGIHYIGDYKPVKVMRNNIMLAGYETVEKTGESIAWTDTYNDVIRSASVDGKSTQAVTQGKNLLDISRVELGTLDQTTGAKIAGISSQVRTTYSVSLTQGQSIVYSTSGASNSRVFYFATTGAYLGTQLMTPNGIFTATQNCNVVFTSSSAGFGAPTTYQYEIGTVPTAHEAFRTSPSPTYPSPILSAGNCNLVSRNADGSPVSSIAIPELGGLPNGVADTLADLGGGWWRWARNAHEVILTGTQNSFIERSTTDFNLFTVYIASAPSCAGDWGSNATWYRCTHGRPTNSLEQVYYATGEGIAWDGRAGLFGIRFCIRKGYLGIVDLASFNVWLADQYAAGTPVTVQYRLATPIMTDLNLGQLKTFPRFTRLEQDGATLATITAKARVAG